MENKWQEVLKEKHTSDKYSIYDDLEKIAVDGGYLYRSAITIVNKSASPFNVIPSQAMVFVPNCENKECVTPVGV